MPGVRAPEEARREQIVVAAYEIALRKGIAGLTLRAVAARAGLSHGLVVFYFKRKDLLIAALLDRVLATVALLHVAEGVDGTRSGRARLSALVRQEMARAMEDPHGIRLFVEYWALGVRQAAVRRRIGQALERYRSAFRAIAEEMLPPTPVSSISPGALAAVAVSLIHGCAMQALIDPERFDGGAYAVAVDRLIDRLAPA